MSTKAKVSAGAGALVAALLGVFVWYFFGSSADEAVNLAGALDAVGASDQPTEQPSENQATTETSLRADEVDGTWEVRPNEAGEVNDGSFVGYRIQEELERVGSTTATGRTPGVTGEITIEDGALVGATLVADMTSLQSDRSQRDRAIATRGIEYNTFPSATFTLTQSSTIDVDALVKGMAQVVTVTGDLDLHGVVQNYTLDLEVQATGRTVVVVGSLEIDLAAHAIDKPVVGPVLSISDTGTLEFQVFFRKP